MTALIRRIAAKFETKPFPLLTRHFFNRLFQNDIFPFRDQMKEKVGVLLALVAALGWVMENTFLMKYVFIADNGESWLEKCQFLSFFMVLLAFAVILEWDVLFLDKRDYVNLMALPVKTETVILAKSASMFIFVLLYSAAACSFSFLIVAFVLPGWISKSLEILALYFVAHLASATAAFIFVFLLVGAGEAVLMILFGPRLFRTLSLVIRFVLLVGSIYLLMMFLANPIALRSFYASLGDLKNRGDSRMLFFPPLWFAGIQEMIIGRRDPLYSSGAHIGLAVIIVLGVIYFLALLFSYKKHALKTLEISARPVFFRLARRRLSTMFDSIFLKDSVQRAVFHFFGKTLENSPLHKIRLAGYLAFATGFLLLLFGAQKDALKNLTMTNMHLLAIPLILAFFLLVGLRSLVNVPLAAEANWVFPLTEAKTPTPYFIGLKKAVFFYAVLPLFGALAVVFALVWKLGPALLHVGYGLSFALLLGELLFWKFRKIPFVCATVPGRAKLQYLWFFYAAAFLLTVSALSSLEAMLFRNPGSFAVYFAIAAVIICGLELYQRFFVYEKIRLQYEDKPEPVMITLTET